VKTGSVGSVGEPKKPTKENRFKETICGYLRDLRFLLGWTALGLCDSVVFSRVGSQQTGGRMVPECSKLTARFPVVHAMHAGADLITFSTKTSCGM